MKSNKTSIEPDITDFYLLWQYEISTILERVIQARLSKFKSELEKEKGAQLRRGSVMVEQRDDGFWVDEHHGPYESVVDYIKQELDCNFYDAVRWVLDFAETIPDEVHLADRV